MAKEVIIANRGVPIAKIVSYDPPTKRQLGFVKGQLPESFFNPLPDDDLELWGLR